MLNRGAILIAWAITVILGSALIALVLQGGEALGVSLAISSGASLPYLAAYLVFAPRLTSFGRQQLLHVGLAMATLLVLLPFVSAFALFLLPYWVIGVVCHLLLRRAPAPAAAQTPEARSA